MGIHEIFYWKGCFLCGILFIYSQIEYRKIKLNSNEGAEMLIYVLMKNKKKLHKLKKGPSISNGNILWKELLFKF